MRSTACGCGGICNVGAHQGVCARAVSAARAAAARGGRPLRGAVRGHLDERDFGRHRQQAGHADLWRFDLHHRRSGRRARRADQGAARARMGRRPIHRRTGVWQGRQGVCALCARRAHRRAGHRPKPDAGRPDGRRPDRRGNAGDRPLRHGRSGVFAAGGLLGRAGRRADDPVRGLRAGRTARGAGHQPRVGIAARTDHHRRHGPRADRLFTVSARQPARHAHPRRAHHLRRGGRHCGAGRAHAVVPARVQARPDDAGHGCAALAASGRAQRIGRCGEGSLRRRHHRRPAQDRAGWGRSIYPRGQHGAGRPDAVADLCAPNPRRRHGAEVQHAAPARRKGMRALAGHSDRAAAAQLRQPRRGARRAVRHIRHHPRHARRVGGCCR